MYLENETAVKKNKAVPNDLRGDIYTIEKVSDSSKDSAALIQDAQSQ